MIINENLKNNSLCAAAAVDATVKVITAMSGGKIGGVDKETIAQVAATEINNQIINRGSNNAN